MYINANVFGIAVATEDGRPAEDQGPVRGAGEQGGPLGEPEFAATGLEHAPGELSHEAQAAPSAIQKGPHEFRGQRAEQQQQQ